MTFQLIKFPELRLKHGIEKTINDPVNITTNGNREIRRKLNKTERYSWKIPARMLYQEDMDEIVEFFNTTQSSMDTFLYRDPTKPELIAQSLKAFTSGGTLWFLCLHSGNHPIINLGASGFSALWDMSDLVIKRNGVVVNQSSITVSMNHDFGDAAPYPRCTAIRPTGGGWSAGDIITIGGPIYSTVRFDSMVSYKIAAMQKSSLITGDCEVVPTVSELSDIQLMEVFEYYGE